MLDAFLIEFHSTGHEKSLIFGTPFAYIKLRKEKIDFFFGIRIRIFFQIKFYTIFYLLLKMIQ